MKLIVNKRFNNLHSLLSSFMFIVNHDYFEEQLEERWNIQIPRGTRDLVKEVRQNPIFYEARYILDMGLASRDIFIDPYLVEESEDFEDYSKDLLGQDQDLLRRKIFEKMKWEIPKGLGREDYLRAGLNQIEKMEIEDGAKWYLLSLVKDPRSYLEKFIELVEDYLPLYEEIKEGYWGDYLDFVDWLDQIINYQGIDFLDRYLAFINLKEFDEIHLNYSIFDLVTSKERGDGKIKIYLGLIFRKYIESERNKNNLDKYLNIYKLLSDRTRFDIIRILMDKESYGQEIAEKLGITTATVSYHMEYLFAASLIFMTRKSRRIYYSINKEEIRKAIGFLEREFSL